LFRRIPIHLPNLPFYNDLNRQQFQAPSLSIGAKMSTPLERLPDQPFRRMIAARSGL
jgi:hypothetical protein